MPERTACDEAIRLSPTRLRIPDPDLKQGKVEMFQIPTARHVIERPWGIEGGFAVVYKFRTASGKLRALRCFRVPMDQDTQMRYESIGPYFAQHAPKVTATFKYYQQGIMIKETVYGSVRETVYPLIEMEWVEGDILLDKVDALCQQADRKGLEQIIQQWLTLLHILQQEQIAHGDLSGNNIMVCPDSRLILIDYDGSYIPDFAGMKPVVAGQPDYQHHQVQQRAFDEHMDHFSALVIYTALVALQAEPALWNAHMQRNQHGKLIGTNLLFLKEDYLDPDQSALFAKLAKMGDARVKASIKALKLACYKQIDDVTFPWDIIDPDYMQKQAVAAFRTALASRSVQAIASAYLPTLDTAKDITAIEREVARQAQRFMQAYTLDHDESLLASFDQIRSRNPQRFAFTRPEQQRIQLARQRIDALTKWRNSIRSKHLQEIITHYDAILDQHPSITPYEQGLLILARDFQQACQSDDDEALARFDRKLRGSHYQNAILLTGQEQQRLQVAQKRAAALTRFRRALQSCLLEKIIANYDPILQQCVSVRQDELSILSLAREFKQAFDDDSDQQLIEAWEKLLQANNPSALQFTPQQQQRFDLAQQRIQALKHFRTVIQQQSKPRDAQQLLVAYDPILETCPGSITQEENALLSAARRFVSIYQELLDALQNNDEKRICTLYSTDMEEFLANFTPQQRKQLNEAEKHHRLDQLLARSAYEEAVQLAYEIEKAKHAIIYDARLVQARQKFIRQFDAKEVTAQLLHSNDIMIRWHWPENELIEIAFVLWRPDRWPRPPQQRENGTQLSIVIRNPKERDGMLRLAYPYRQAYVHVFMAIADYTQQRANWFYSRGNEPTSRSIASFG